MKNKFYRLFSSEIGKISWDFGEHLSKISQSDVTKFEQILKDLDIPQYQSFGEQFTAENMAEGLYDADKLAELTEKATKAGRIDEVNEILNKYSPTKETGGTAAKYNPKVTKTKERKVKKAVTQKLTISPSDAANGIKKLLTISGKQLEVIIPAGVKTGTVVKLSGAIQTPDGYLNDILLHIRVSRKQREKAAINKALLFFLCLGVIGAVIYSFVVIANRNTLRTELESVRTDLAKTQLELNSTKQTLSATQKELSVANETLKGLGITISSSNKNTDIVLNDNPIATNPTFNQLMTFLAQDKTENHAYIADVYDCSQYSRDVHNNAEVKGIRTAVVQVSFRNQSKGHELNAFITTDHGLVYIDCTRQPDKIDRVEINKTLRAVALKDFQPKNIRNNYFWDTLRVYYSLDSISEGEPESVVSDITIFW